MFIRSIGGGMGLVKRRGSVGSYIEGLWDIRRMSV